MRSVFITGTDTAVGKTVVTAALLAMARARGVNAAPMKPVQTGCVRRTAGWVAQDLDLCLRRAGFAPSAEERAALAPYRFRLAASPHRAAAEAGSRLSVARLAACCRRVMGKYDALLVEGAGGVLVPLNDRETMRDLMRALGLPVLVVARPSLGTLNHTLLTLEALRAAGLDVLGVVLNAARPGGAGPMARSNAAAIRTFGRVRVEGPLRHGADCSARASSAAFRRATGPLAERVLAWLD